MSDRIRVRYAPSPTGYLHIKMQEQHYSITCMLNITTEIL